VLGRQHLPLAIQGQAIGHARRIRGELRALRQAAPAHDPLIGNIAEEEGGAPPHRPFGKAQAARNACEGGLRGNERVQVWVAYVQRDRPAAAGRLCPDVTETSRHGEAADGSRESQQVPTGETGMWRHGVPPFGQEMA
jgi:hypothetical protein